jgi:uncharacterized membrane protein
MASRDSRPWFGPKRVGYGYRPQTGPGWLIMALLVVVVAVVALIVGH